jgi:hypothetical protein
MHRRAYSRKPHVSRNIKNEILVLRLLFGAFILSAGVVWLSLGHRSQLSETDQANEFFRRIATQIRKSEATIEVNEAKSISDLRSHVGYQLEWDTKFNPPQWSLTKSGAQNRLEQFEQLIRIGKSSLRLRPSAQNSLVFQAQEEIANTGGSASAIKNVIPVLPGERVLLSFAHETGKARNWKIRVRAVAVTQDRLDSSLPLSAGFSTSALTKYEIEPKGQPLDIDIPSVAEFAEHEDAQFALEWPTSASGILFVDGFQPSVIEGENRQMLTRSLVVQIDSLDGELNQLQRTLQILRASESFTSPVLHFTKVIPPASNATVSELSVLTGRKPSDLGFPLQNTALKDLIQPQLTLLNLIHAQGGSTRRITLTTDTRCDRDCKAAETLYSQSFNSHIKVERREEFASTHSFLRNDESLSDPGLLYVQFKIPSETLRLNWESTHLSKSSTARWIVAGVRDFLGFRNSALKDEEKLQQADIWLAKLIEKFQSVSSPANIALLVHNNKKPLSPSETATEGREMLRGQALFKLSQLVVSDAQKKGLIQIDAPTGLSQAVSFFSKAASMEAKLTLTEKELFEMFSLEGKAVSQLNEHDHMTLTNDGWLIDPLKTEVNDSRRRDLFFAKPEHVAQIQKMANKEKRFDKLLGLNIKFPATNNAEESLETHLSTSFNALGCESRSENAQLKETSKSQETEKEFPESIILGRRPAQSAWHIFCLLEGRISENSFTRLSFRLNQRPVAREAIGLGEFALPLRGFLWHSPDAVEFQGAQILDATVANNEPDESLSLGSKVLIWSERIPVGLAQSRTHFSFATELQKKSAESEQSRLSGK